MSTKIELLLQLKTQLVNFLDELIDSFPKEADFVIFRIFVKDQTPIELIMNYVVEKLVPLQDLVKKRDEKFFLNNNIFFEEFSNEKMHRVLHFKSLWQSGTLDEDDKDAIWRWFSIFIAIGNKYKDLKG